MKFLTKSWIELQFSNFSKKISSVFVRKSDLKEYKPLEPGIYKIATDKYGKISSATPVKKQDLLDFGIVTEYDFEIKDGYLYYSPKTDKNISG